MNIQEIIQNYSGAISMLFDVYGIQQPVNYDTVSAAITLYSSDEGNPFLSDLLSAIDGNSYEGYDEILGLGKKGKARRQEKREARGGYSRIGAIGRKLGIAKNRPPQAGKANREANINTPSETPLTNEANMADEKAPSKVTADSVLNTIEKGIGIVGGAVGAIRGAGAGADEGGGIGDGDGGGYSDQAQKWYQKPIVLVGIGLGVVAVIGIMIAVFKGKK